MSKHGKTPLDQLPIDQYSRQKWASLFIDHLRADNQHFTILDVGGYKGKTGEFQTTDKVTVCDLFDIKENGYVRGDGRHLPFEDKSFDFVVSFDTYEHVPRAGRKSFLNEQARVAKHGIILAAPFDDPGKNVSKAEINLNQYYNDLYKVDHPWLQEHIDYVLSNQIEIETLLKALDLQFISIQSNDLGLWSLIQHLYFSIEIDEDFRGRVDDVNRFYNHHLTDIDITNGMSYRRVYYISSNGESVDKITRYINKQGRLHESVKDEFISLAMTTFGKKYRDVELYKNYLENELAASHRTLETERQDNRKTIDHLQRELSMKFGKRLARKAGHLFKSSS